MGKLFTALMFCLFCISPCFAASADYPVKPITVIVPFAPGGMADVSVRLLADPLAKELGQPLVILNKSGGAGITGVVQALNSPPDGYTLSGGLTPGCIAAPYFLGAEKFNLNAISYVGSYMPQERILLAAPGRPYKNWKEFVAFARANPGKASIGSGSGPWGQEIIKYACKKEGLDVKFIMHKSGGEASADLLGGHVDLCEMGVGTPGYQAAREGIVAVIVNIGNGKIPHFESVPSLKDLGYGFATDYSYGFVMPGGTPEPIRARWEAALKKVLADPAVAAKMQGLEYTPEFHDGARYKQALLDVQTAMPALVEAGKPASK